MYAVGRVGTYIAQGVYTVSGPFHPFGGAVDIIVVQQEDGTFKTSPWYVRFGKFQGVLKRRENKVIVEVNDSVANFHMYLDHKGEAYFLKDAQGDNDIATFSPTEAASSGDEASSHVLALEYPKGEEGQDARAEHGKEESEDERGDDLELRFEGREASKQLIQQSVGEPKTNAPVVEEISFTQGKSTGDLGIQERIGDSDLSSNQDDIRSELPVTDQKSSRSNGESLRSSFDNQEVDLGAGQRSMPASTLVTKAAVAAVEASSTPYDATSKAVSTTDRETANDDSTILRGLINQAVSLQASDSSGPANALAESEASSLQNPVSHGQLETLLETSHSQPKLVDVLEDDLDEENSLTVPATVGVELYGELKEKVPPGESSVSNPEAIEPPTSNRRRLSDPRLRSTANILENLPGLEGGETELRGESFVDPALLGRNLHVSEFAKILQVRNVEVLEKSLVVEVEEIEGKGVDGAIATEGKHKEKESGISAHTNGTLENIVIDRKHIIEKILNLHDSTARNGASGESENNNVQELEVAHEQQHIRPEEAGDEKVTVHVDKLVAENLNDTLLQNDIGPKVILTEVKDLTTVGKEVALISSETAGIVSTKSTTAGEELAFLSPVNLTDVGSPRLKAAIELEMAWRDVIEKAATTLKVAPYTSKRLYDSQSFKKGSSASKSIQKKLGGMDRLPEQSERKSWGGWFWGASIAPQSKHTAEQSSLKDQQNIQRESSMELRVPDLSNDEFRDESKVVSDLENATKSKTHIKHGAGFYEVSDSKFEAADNGCQIVSDLRPDVLTEFPAEGRKAGDESNVSRQNLENQGDSSESKSQEKGHGEPPPRRRSLFGLLRSNTNQSFSSSISLRQGSDDFQPMVEGLKRETPLDVVDLLEVKWARGSAEATKGLMAIAGVPDTRIVKEKGGHNGEIEHRQCQNLGTPLRQIDIVDSSVAVDYPDNGAQENKCLDDPNPEVSAVETTGAELVIRQVVGKKCENLGASNLEFDEVTGMIQEAEEEAEVVSEDSDGHLSETEVFRNRLEGSNTLVSEAGSQDGHLTEIEVLTNGLEGANTPTVTVSDPDPDQFISFPNTEVVLMSIDGHLITAPLVSSDEEPPQASHELLERVCYEDVENRRYCRSPRQHAVSFTGIAQGSSGISPYIPRLLWNDEQNIQPGNSLGHYEQPGQESDRYVSNSSVRDIKSYPSSHELTNLTKLVGVDDVGASPSKIETSDADKTGRLALECAQDELGLKPETETSMQKNDMNRESIATIDSKYFENMRALVLDLHSDEDDLGPKHGGLERFFSSKDLTETEEGVEGSAFKRNASVYMDAISGEEDEQEFAGSIHEDDLDQSRLKSSPIVIPGAFERAQNSHSLDDIRILRSTSESLPNARLHATNSEMSSPRPTLSRSLGSEPLPIVLPLDMREPSTPSDGFVTCSPSISISQIGLEKEPEEIVAERATEKAEGEFEKQSECRMTSTMSGSMDEREKGSATGFELSLCRHQLSERMGIEAAAKAFDSEKVTLDEFKKSGSAISANDKLVVRVGGRYYPWVVAAPIILGILAFGQVLTAPNEGAIPVEQPVVVVDGKATKGRLTTTSSSGWKLWPFKSIRRPKTPEKGTVPVLVSRDALIVATEAVLKSSITKQYLQMNGYYTRPRKVRTNSPSSQQLASLNLKEGSNKITFTFVTGMLGKQQVDARIYLWKWNTRIVISDVDGTITKSDVLGQVMPLVGKDWTQSGVAKLFSAIKNNGYELMFLSARAISQAYLTRQFLENIKQDGDVLPDGPVVISPDGLFPSLYREVIRRAPHEFKIACLEDIKSLFPPESKPFYAGFGNRDTDELSYLKVGISKGKIFIINPKGEVVVNNQVDIKSYTSLHKLVDDMFPAVTLTEQEDFNEWNFWKLPLPDVEDEPSVKSVGSSSSRRGVKSGR